MAHAKDPAEGRLAPEVFEPIWRQLRIAHRVLDIPMAEIRLQSPGVDAFVGEGKRASMPQQMWMRFET
jgi:hypothetical protein